MKKFLVLSVLLCGFTVMGFSSLPIPQREIALGQTILADNYAFHIFPSLLPKEDSQMWMTFSGGNFANVAIFCKKSPLFNLFLIHDNFVKPVAAVNTLLTVAAANSGNFTYNAALTHSPLNIGYALDLGVISAGIFFDYQYFNDNGKTYAGSTNLFAVNNSVFDITPGASISLGGLDIDVSLPIRLSILSYSDTIASATVTNSRSLSADALNTFGTTAKATFKLSDMLTLGAQVMWSTESLNYSYTTNSYQETITTNVTSSSSNTFMAKVGFICTPSEKISFFGDVSYGMYTKNLGQHQIITNNQIVTNITPANNIETLYTLLPTMNFGIEINLGNVKPRFGIINTYTQTKVIDEETGNETFTQPTAAQLLTAGIGLTLGDFQIDGTFATGANSLLAALNNPLAVPATIFNAGHPGMLTAVFTSVEVSYRF